VDDYYLFCHFCYTAIQHGRPPKYAILNDINVTFCQHYPDILNDLTLTEECLIARYHPIASILKLRPNGSSTPLAYNRLHGHIVVLPQDPGPLLEILPSAELRLLDNIKVVWFSNTAPTSDDLRPYLEVRKEVVYSALQWLCRHNELYSQITVNNELLDSWPDSFIPGDLQDSVVCTVDDLDEREGYAADLTMRDYENDLQEAIPDELPQMISSGCVYSDVELARQRPALHLISTVMNMERERFKREAVAASSSHYVEDIPVIRYRSNGRSVLMNDWQDAEYFTGSFPTLFPLGTGGHISAPSKRKVSLSLKAWAKWALNHHSRRYVKGPVVIHGQQLTLLSFQSLYLMC
jgi:hypothetical protein